MFDVTGEAADEKSPKSPPKLSLRGADTTGCVGGEACFNGGAGLESKNDPPLSAGFEMLDGCLVLPVGDVRLENGDGLVCVCGGELKDRELKASFMPPNCCGGGCC